MENSEASAFLEAFINDCRFRNLREKTISEYKWYLEYIQNNVGDLLEIDRQAIKDMAVSRINSGLKATTVNHYIKAIKVFYSFLEREEYIENNPMEKLRKIPEPKIVKPVLDVSQISKLLKQIPIRGFYHLRARSMIMLMWDTAVRLNELLSIEFSDIDLQTRTIKIKGKGRKERIVPFGSRTKNELKRYIKIWTEKQSPYLFCTRDGLKLDKRKFQDILYTYGRKIGLHVNPHLIRHSAATFLAKSEMPAQHIQILLGHSNLNTIQRYINQIVNQKGLQISHRRLSPGDRL